jgi:hypothetical protein
MAKYKITMFIDDDPDGDGYAQVHLGDDIDDVTRTVKVLIWIGTKHQDTDFYDIVVEKVTKE